MAETAMWKEKPSMQTPRSSKPRQSIGPIVLPRVPTFGPASQLSPEVLVTSMAQGSLNQSGRRRFRSHEPRVDKGRLGDTLPSLPGQRSARGARTSFEPVKTAKGLWSVLYAGDHPDIGFRDNSLAFPEGGGGSDSPSIRTLSQLSAITGLEELSAAASPVHGISESAAMESPTQAGGDSAVTGSLVSPGARRSSGGGLLGMGCRASDRGEYSQRHRDLRASFHLDLAAVEAGHMRLHRFQNTTEMEMRSESVFPEVNHLAAKFEKTGIASRPPRQTVLEVQAPDELQLPENSLLKAIIQDDDDSVALTDGLTVASSTEISTCASVLNFYRWLCGLPLVQLCSARLAVCNIVSICLLGRCNAKNFRLPSEAKEFTEAILAVLSENGSRLSVLQGDASLVSAVDRSISSTDAISVPAGLSTIEDCDSVQLAQDLADEVEAGPAEMTSAFPTSSRRKSTLGSKPSKQAARSKVSQATPRRASIETSSPLCAHEALPEPLLPLRVLWDLNTDSREADAAAPVSTHHAHASHPATHRPHGAKTRKGDHHKPQEDAVPGGLSAIWGDREGALNLRRCLLSPALREFGVARRQDTCVLWTSSDKGLKKEEAKGALSAMQKLEELYKGSKQSGSKGLPGGGSSPKRERGPSKASDRSDSKGGPSTLTSFAKGRAESDAPGAAAFKLGAVCWPPAGFVPLTLLEYGCVAWTIMPDSTRFQPTANTNIRMWRVQIDRPPGGMWTAERQSEVAVRGFAVDCSSHGEPFCVVFWPDLPRYTHGLQFEVLLEGLRGETTSLTFFYEFRAYLQHVLNDNLCKEAAAFRNLVGDRCFWGEPRDAGVDYKVEAEKAPKRRPAFEPSVSLPVIEFVSYHEKAFSTNSVDVTIVLKCAEAATITGQLNLLRFSGEEEMIPCGTQVQRLGRDHFVLRAKMPMSRCRFELRLMTTTFDNPRETQQHPVKYLISTSSSCQTLLSSMEDPKWRKFGLTPHQPVAQRYGVFILTPWTRRVHVGQCYFLLYIDKSLALQMAAAEVAEARKEDVDDASFMKRRLAMKSPKGRHKPTSKMLFAKRLMCEDSASRSVTASSGFGEAALKIGEHVTVHELQRHLCRVLQPHTQDTAAEIHLDIALRSGEVLHRLRERSDFPGLFEGFFNFEASDASSLVRLYIRFPQLHAFEYAPRKLAEWLVCRNEHFPINF